MLDRNDTVEIKRLSADDGSRFRDVRLRALKDSPDAFGRTYLESVDRSIERWSAQIQEIATFVAVKNGRDAGLLRCAIDEDDSATAWLISMWVAPEARGQLVSDALIDTAIGWAISNDAARLLLDVGDHNRPAIALYERKGFKRTGEVGSLPPPRNHILEHRRELIL